MPSDPTPLAPGLYLVATPIGNLGDITLRALDVLRRADRICCEDTRQTQKLLNHYAISTRTESLHEHNEHERSLSLVESLRNGARIAIVTDAGMPGISDPGMLLARAAIGAGIPVIPIPGANAALTALVASGLPSAEFTYLGFLPEKAGPRRTRLESIAEQAGTAPRTLIFYEAPHRILDTLADLESVFGPDLPIVLARELTKAYEEFLRGPVAQIRSQLASRDRVRGEITLLIEAPARALGPGAPGPSPLGTRDSIMDRVAQLQSGSGMDEKEALKHLARELNRSKSDLYRELQRQRARRKP
ncbi:MAG TPA: 16S rRNA (cytidine(1402)-2'-O)-methyltransferase [Terracidiphilus sp.]|jgi:16S rRNA (cytidine1402-2'-O)-methyltransferase|nr:16S rRNA (cytidine(1402)-2'-O)-methyltransferase [Terracidiphilus sp.]